MRRWNDLIYNAVRRWIDLVLRRRTAPVLLMKAGSGLIFSSLAIGALAGSFSWDSPYGLVAVIIETEGGGLSVGWIAVAFLAGLVLLGVGAALQVRDHLRDSRRIVVIEQRGLHRGVDTPLAEQLPSDLAGRIDTVVLDHRQLTGTAEIPAPEDALQQLHSLRGVIRERRDAVGPGKAALVYGGMAPVPLTFLTGMLVGDESAVSVMDWDRTQSRWRELDSCDDGERFEVDGLGEFGDPVDHPHGSEAAIAIAVSYPSDLEAIGRTVGNLPIIRMSLPTPGVDQHWSRDKQAALCLQFCDVLARVMQHGVRRVHLFVAAPNSLVFNLGRHYDDRLHPEASVYQYERSMIPPFPWAIELPTHGRRDAILRREHPAAA